MPLIPRECPNCGAPVKSRYTHHTECEYCFSPLSEESPLGENIRPARPYPVDRTAKSKAGHKRRKRTPMLAVFVWVAVTSFMAIKVGTSSGWDNAIAPAFIGALGAYLMLSKRRKQRRR